MFKDLFQLYQIGKELGLTRKEINRTFFFKEESHSFKNRIIFYTIILIIMILIGATIIFVTQLVSSVTTHTNNTYPSGTLYSTVKEKDFKSKNKKKRYNIC